MDSKENILKSEELIEVNDVNLEDKEFLEELEKLKIENEKLKNELKEALNNNNK
eukprot:jgi/Orpsp1_1/1192169/evm.model.d7180000091058.1